VIPEGASFCPKCGRQVTTIAGAHSSGPPQSGDGPPKEKSNKALGCFAIVAVILFILWAIGSSLQPEGRTQGAAATDPAVLPLAVTATELFNAYQSNEASAQSYFGSRPLLVSGTVRKVSLDMTDDPVVELVVPNQFMSAQAMLAEDAKDQAGNFNPGDEVKLLCEDLAEVMSMPMMRNCRTAGAGQKSQPIEWSK